MFRKKKISVEWRERCFYYLLILPTLLYLLIFQAFPILYSVFLGFTDLSLVRPNSGGFNGLDNYIKLLTKDINFWPVFKNTLVWVFGATILQYLAAIPSSLILNQRVRFRGLWRGLAMVPWVIPTIIMGMIWKWIFDGEYGLLNYILGTEIVWLANKATVWPSLLLVATWKGMPYATLMLLAGLQSIPIELYEAARIDGCNAWGRFRYVTIPMLKPALLVTVLTSIVQSWTKFEVIWVLTGGGPGYTTSILPTYIYSKAFQSYDLGGASSIAVLSMLFMVVFIVIYLKVYNKKEE